MAEKSEHQQDAEKRALDDAGMLHDDSIRGHALTAYADAQPVQLRTRRDNELAVTALKKRAAELQKLAEKPRSEGYLTAAREIEADADAILEYLLPQFAEQADLGLDFTESLAAAARGTCSDLVRNVMWDHTLREGQDEHDAMTPAQMEALARGLAGRVVAFALRVSTKSYAAGFAARSTTPEVLAYGCLSALR